MLCDIKICESNLYRVYHCPIFKGSICLWQDVVKVCRRNWIKLNTTDEPKVFIKTILGFKRKKTHTFQIYTYYNLYRNQKKPKGNTCVYINISLIARLTKFFTREHHHVMWSLFILKTSASEKIHWYLSMNPLNCHCSGKHHVQKPRFPRMFLPRERKNRCTYVS